MNQTIHVVDDDADTRDSLAWLFDSRGHECRTWDGGERFLAHVSACPLTTPPAAVLLDIRMEPMSGLATFSRLRAAGNSWPVLFLTGHGDVGMAVAAVKAGAMDFLEKPFQNNQLVDKVESALAFARSDAAFRVEADRFRSAYQQLSARERDVMKLVLEGRYNKNIGDMLGIAPRTVEFHRANVFLKMGVSRAVELAHKLGLYRVDDLLVTCDKA